MESASKISAYASRINERRGKHMLFCLEYDEAHNYYSQDVVEAPDTGEFYICIQDNGPDFGGIKDLDQEEYWTKIAGGGGASLERYEVVGIANAENDVNYITAYKLNSDATRIKDSNDQDKLFYVALPRSIQRSLWRNKTVNGWKLMKPPAGIDSQERRKVAVSVTGVPANTIVREVIEPRYNAGDYIYAFTGTTGVTVTGIGTLTLMDANIDARKWTYPSYAVKACVNGVTQDVVVPTGLNFWLPLTTEDP